jgi:hypothetical protein
VPCLLGHQVGVERDVCHGTRGCHGTDGRGDVDHVAGGPDSEHVFRPVGWVKMCAPNARRLLARREPQVAQEARPGHPAAALRPGRAGDDRTVSEADSDEPVVRHLEGDDVAFDEPNTRTLKRLGLLIGVASCG